MLPIQRMPRRSTLWGAAFLSLVPLHVTAQVQTTVAPSLPSLTPEDKSPNDPEAIYCRPPQAQTESRMLGPRVCKKNKEWENVCVVANSVVSNRQARAATRTFLKSRLGVELTESEQRNLSDQAARKAA